MRHTVHQSLDVLKRDGFPSLLYHPHQMLPVLGLPWATVHCGLDITPQVLNWIEIRALCGPGEALYPACFPDSSGNLGTMWQSVVLLEDSITLGKYLAEG